MPLFLALLLVPLIEIALFVKVGGAIGLWPTLAIVIGTAVLGSQLLRRQGAGAMNALRSSLSEMRDPTGPLFDGAMILVSGVLLLTPGFFTDTMGLLLLVPQVRAMLYHRIRARVEVRGFGAGMGGGQSARPRGPESDVLEGEYHRIDPDEPPSRH